MDHVDLISKNRAKDIHEKFYTFKSIYYVGCPFDSGSCYSIFVYISVALTYTGEMAIPNNKGATYVARIISAHISIPLANE